MKSVTQCYRWNATHSSTSVARTYVFRLEIFILLYTRQMVSLFFHQVLNYAQIAGNFHQVAKIYTIVSQKNAHIVTPNTYFWTDSCIGSKLSATLERTSGS